jgi:hypothetical protein
MSCRYEFGERQHAPAITARAVRRELVAVFVQAGEGAEVDHSVRVAPTPDSGSNTAPFYCRLLVVLQHALHCSVSRLPMCGVRSLGPITMNM